MAELTASSPPAGSEIRHWVLDTPKQLKDLRANLHEALTGRPLPTGASLEEIPEKVVLVATELATNALRHGMPPTIVRLCRTPDRYVLDVVDHDPTAVPVYAEERPTGAGGLGLQLARRLALDLGWYVADGTKHVWAQFPISAR